jgi:hypothetical protein
MSSPYQLYRGRTSQKEIDLRSELNRSLFGATDEIPKGKVGLLRRMREDSDGNFIKCSCRDPGTFEADKDTFCRYCHSHGWYWDEYYVVYYKNNKLFSTDETSSEEFTYNTFYFEWDVDIRPDDFIVEVKLDKEGRPVLPVIRQRLYDIIRADDLRADSGRVEFWQVEARERREWSVWYGVHNRLL